MAYNNYRSLLPIREIDEYDETFNRAKTEISNTKAGSIQRLDSNEKSVFSFVYAYISLYSKKLRIVSFRNTGKTAFRTEDSETLFLVDKKLSTAVWKTKKRDGSVYECELIIDNIGIIIDTVRSWIIREENFDPKEESGSVPKRKDWGSKVITEGDNSPSKRLEQLIFESQLTSSLQYDEQKRIFDLCSFALYKKPKNINVSIAETTIDVFYDGVILFKLEPKDNSLRLKWALNKSGTEFYRDADSAAFNKILELIESHENQVKQERKLKEEEELRKKKKRNECLSQFEHPYSSFLKWCSTDTLSLIVRVSAVIQNKYPELVMEETDTNIRFKNRAYSILSPRSVFYFGKDKENGCAVFNNIDIPDDYRNGGRTKPSVITLNQANLEKIFEIIEGWKKKSAELNSIINKKNGPSSPEKPTEQRTSEQEELVQIVDDWVSEPEKRTQKKVNNIVDDNNVEGIDFNYRHSPKIKAKLEYVDEIEPYAYFDFVQLSRENPLIGKAFLNRYCLDNFSSEKLIDDLLSVPVIKQTQNSSVFFKYLESGSSIPFVKYYSDAVLSEQRRLNILKSDDNKAVIEEEEAVLNKLNSTVKDMISYGKSKIPDNEFSFDYDDESYTKNRGDINSKEYWCETIPQLNSLLNKGYFQRAVYNDDDVNHFVIDNLPLSFKVFETWGVDFLHPSFSIAKKVLSNEPYFYANSTTTKKTLIAENRRVSIHNGKVIEAKVLRSGGHDVSGGSVIEPGEIDPFLKNVYLARRGDPSMSSIISTIQDDQDKIVNEDFKHHIFVTGCAGSGKTVILLERLTRYVNSIRNSKDISLKQVVYVVPNRGFKNHMGPLIAENGLNGISILTMSEYMVSMLNRYKESVSMAKGISENKVWYENRIKLCCLDSEFDYQEVKDFIYSTELDKFIRSFNKHFTSEFIKTLFADKKWFYSENSAFDYVLDQFEKNLRHHLNIRQTIFANKWPSCYVYAILKMFKARFTRNDFFKSDSLILIDECQDFYFELFKIAKKLNSRAVFNFYGDFNQDLSDHEGRWDYDRLNRAFGGALKHFRLDYNYRNSNEIVDYYNQKLGMSDKKMGLSTKVPNDDITGRDILYSILAYHSWASNEIAIIYDEKSNQKIENVFKPKFDEYKIKAKFYTPLQAKGLEFDVVFVIGSSRMNKKERYVSYSRAKSELYIYVGR